MLTYLELDESRCYIHLWCWYIELPEWEACHSLLCSGFTLKLPFVFFVCSILIYMVRVYLSEAQSFCFSMCSGWCLPILSVPLTRTPNAHIVYTTGIKFKDRLVCTDLLYLVEIHSVTLTWCDNKPGRNLILFTWDFSWFLLYLPPALNTSTLLTLFGQLWHFSGMRSCGLWRRHRLLGELP